MLYYTYNIVKRNPPNPILVIKAPTLVLLALIVIRPGLLSGDSMEHLKQLLTTIFHPTHSTFLLCLP